MIIIARPQIAVARPAIQIAPCAEIYIVQANDWLSKISDKFLGDFKAYPAIVTATNQQAETDETFAHIANPNQIKMGWKLCIPANPAAEVLLTEAITVSLPPRSTAPIITAEPYTLDDFVAEFPFGPEVQAGWIYSSPEQPAKFSVLPEHRQTAADYGYRANYLWNEHLQDDYYINSSVFRMAPEEVKLYEAPWGTIFPRYRYPARVTLPTGLTTNQFGWRGPSITLDKPGRTIRIACVGASTTVDGHNLPYSYPELLEHWLNLWAQENEYDLQFEVINAGREGIGSKDIAAVVRYEILPMDVDYVIYYEGSNQFNVQSMINYSFEVTFGQPPAGIVPNFAEVESNDKTFLDRLSEYSALAARARNMVEVYSFKGEEPAKPAQTFQLPPGIDEFRPDRTNLGDALALRKILADLDQIKADLAEQRVKFFLATFDWFAYDGMVLDLTRHRSLYIYLNRLYWPVSYANMRRMADFQNRVFRLWALENRVNVIEVAEQMPRQPDLYIDAIHNTALGVRIRAWLNFEAIVPFLKEDIANGALPRPDRLPLEAHPYIKPIYKVKRLSEAKAR